MPSSQQHNRSQRARGRRHHTTYPSPSIPTFQHVVPTARVSIMLKKDQSTGLEVQGIVGEVLTARDHPRGIKVRLEDGRVGRFQRLLPASMSGVGGCDTAELSLQLLQPRIRTRSSTHEYSDIRFDTNACVVPDRLEASLQDFVKVKRTKKAGVNGKEKEVAVAYEAAAEYSEHITAQRESTTVTCPVCGEFKGDEAAVAYHVNDHFS